MHDQSDTTTTTTTFNVIMMKTASSSSDAPCPAEDAVERKLRQIADRLEQHAAATQTEEDNNDNNSTSPPPLKVVVARPFKDDYQGYFVLTLAYRRSACQLKAEDVLKHAGVAGTKLNAQIWSSCTFQLLIPKYQSDQQQDATATTTGCADDGANAQWMMMMHAKHQLMLIVMKLVLGVASVYFLSCIILHSPDMEGTGVVWSFTRWVKWLVVSTVHLHELTAMPSSWW